MFCVVLCRVLWSADEKEPIYILDITSADCQFTVQEWPSQSWSMYTKNSIKVVFSISYALFVFTSFVHVSLWECCYFDWSLCVLVPVQCGWEGQMDRQYFAGWWLVYWERHHVEEVQQVPPGHWPFGTGHRVPHERVQGEEHQKDKVRIFKALSLVYM